jgi:tetratricopeptide (TPR) repeat protein
MAEANPTIARAQRHLRLGEMKEALALCQKILTDAPDDREGLKLMGHIGITLNRPLVAISNLTRAMASMPNDGETLIQLAEAHKSVGDFRQAMTCFQRTLQLFPGNKAIEAEIATIATYFEMLEGVSPAEQEGSIDSVTFGIALFGRSIRMVIPPEVLRWVAEYKYNLIQPAEAALNHAPDLDIRPELHLILYYYQWIVRDYLELRPLLPRDAKNILNIGGGVALLEILLRAHYYDRSDVRFTVIEQIKMENITHYDGAVVPLESPITILDTARKNAEANEYDNFTGMSSVESEKLRSEKVDCIVSLRSWSYLYSLDTYFDLVRDVLVPDGILILDVSRRNDDLERLSSHFDFQAVIREYQTHRRVVLRCHY